MPCTLGTSGATREVDGPAVDPAIDPAVDPAVFFSRAPEACGRLISVTFRRTTFLVLVCFETRVSFSKPPGSCEGRLNDIDEEVRTENTERGQHCLWAESDVQDGRDLPLFRTPTV